MLSLTVNEKLYSWIILILHGLFMEYWFILIQTIMILTKAISAYIAHDYLRDYKPNKEYTPKYKNTPNSL
jgi:hypothetical protein